MSCSKKRKAFGGFSTARAFMNEINTADAPQQRNDGDNTNAAAGVLETQGTKPVPSEPNKAGSTSSDQNPFTVYLTVMGINYHKENIHSLDSITLHRETENSFDANAICVKNGERNIVGHIAKEQASILARHIDGNIVSLDNVSLKEQREATFLVTAEVNLLDEEKREQFRSEILPEIIGIQTNPTEYQKRDMINDDAVHQLAQGITAQDAETASTCRFDILQMKHVPWKKNVDDTVATWPPNQDFLDKLGLGKADDKQWWQEKTGLKPPSMWNVTGAIDLLPKVPISSHQKTRAIEILDDAVHGVTNVWSDETLEELRTLMQSADFWCYRSSDAFIKAYGGPYVLGQEEGKLKLLKGAPHTSLTEQICRGHNLVYELIHLTKPPEPGFNTLIFGLNLRRSGSHYHQDMIDLLKAKNAPLVSRQLVVTTVYYEKLEDDNGKELVLWKPILNFNPRDDSLYMAARGIQTLHGMVHVQRAGLQSYTQHGVFHTPIFEDGDIEPVSDARRGYRVAITARITFPDSDKRLEPYLENDHYSSVLGPDGNKTICLSRNE